MTVDYWVRAARIFCSQSEFDFPGRIGVRGDRIVAVEQNRHDNPPTTEESGDAIPTYDFTDCLLLPGLIDLHAHPANSGSMFGVEPDANCLRRGTTTVLSQGDAGADSCQQYIRETIKRSQTQVVLAINLSTRGEAGPGGCFSRLDYADVNACVSAIDSARQQIWGIAINTSHNACGATDPKQVLDRGLLAAKTSGLPILYGMRRPEDWPLAEQLRLLRAGDVVTYCFRFTPHCIVDPEGVIPEIRAAREYGIRFDLGHGCGSFSFDVAERAIQSDFLPDTLSSDLQLNHIGKSPTHDLPLVMSKLRAVGMLEEDIFAALTANPARILGLDQEIGSLSIGSRADVTLLRWHDEPRALFDVHGKKRIGGQWTAVTAIRAGVVLPFSHVRES